MSGARAGLRLLLLLVVSLGVGLPVLCVRALLALGGRRAQPLSMRVVLRFQQLWARLLLRVMGVRVSRLPGPPPAGCMIASNHLSYLDIPVIASVLPCRFVSKAEVADWPLVGVLARLAHVLFLDRGRKRDVAVVGGAIRETLQSGVTVTFFPEGTSTRGADVQPFHPGLLEAAAALDIPCLALALRYEAPGAIEPPACTICWWGDMTFLPHAWKLMKLRRIEATVTWSLTTLRASDRKLLASGLHARVSELFVPVRQEALALSSGASAIGVESAVPR